MPEDKQNPLAETTITNVDITLDATEHNLLAAEIDEHDLKSLQRARVDLQSVYHVNQILSAILNTDEIIEKAFDIILADIKGIDYCSIHIMNDDTGKLEFKANRARKPQFTSNYVFSSSILECVTKEMKAVLTLDAQKDERFDGSLSIVEMQIRSAMCVPLQSNNRLLGVIQANNMTLVNNFSVEDLKLMTAMGAIVGAAIENAILYEKLSMEKTALHEAHEQLKIAQNKLIRSEKLAAVGQLTAGIVHDIKNPLMVIMGHGQLLNSILSDAGLKEVDGFDVNGSLKDIEKGAIHCNEIITQLLQFSKQTPPSKELTQLNDLIQKNLEFISYELKKNSVILETDYDNDLPMTMIDVNQFKQTILNIVFNAIQAMEHGGTLKISTEKELGKELTFTVVKIQDNGHGIPDEIRQRIFDPFFSTKKVSEDQPGGTGLGLSVTHGIIESHGGTIDVESTVGEGTTFIIKLPVKEPDN